MAKLAGDHVQVLTDGYELTGDLNRVAIADLRNMYDVTAFRDGVHKYIAGPPAASIEHIGYLNADAARSHPVLKDLAVEGVISVLVGQNADPAVGDPMYSLPVLQAHYGTAPALGGYVPFGARFSNKGSLGGWGVVLTPPVAFTNSTVGSGVNNDILTTNGGAAFLHVLRAATSDWYSFCVEGSATGVFAGEEVTVASFTLDGSKRGSERVAIAGAIPQYTRWKATRSGTAGDAVEIAINLVRY